MLVVERVLIKQKSKAVGRSRHTAPAVFGRFNFFRDLAFIGYSEDLCFGLQDDDDGQTTKPGYPQAPFLRKNRQNFIANLGAILNRNLRWALLTVELT